MRIGIIINFTHGIPDFGNAFHMPTLNKQKNKKGIWPLLGFDVNEEEFELLETENSEPGFFSGYHEQEGKRQEIDPSPVSDILSENEERLRKDFHVDINPDVLLRRFMLGGEIPALAVWINGMADSRQINDFILRQGMRKDCMYGASGELSAYAMENVFAQQEAKLESDWAKVKSAVMEGGTAVLIEGDGKAILMDTRGYEKRGVESPHNEKVIRGPQEGFTENLRTNITLLRRIIRTEDFICEFRDSGGKNNVKLAVAYRAGVVNPKLLKEVKRRLELVNARMVINDGTIEQLTEKHSRTPLPQVLSTERPDRTAALIMQGHVAILLEGSPTSSIMPVTLFTLMATSEDNYMRRPLGAIIRGVRYMGALLSVLLPGYFLAISMHHQGMLSTEVVATIIASRRMVFLPLGLELVFLLWIFQLIREAGVRVPGSVGQAIGIIGGLILGQAAVAANMVSTVALIVVALAGLGNFTMPDYSVQISASYFRVCLVLLAWAGGLLGFMAGILVMSAAMASLKSYGVPFLSPLAPKTYAERPGILRGPISRQNRATDYTNTQEERP